jgi:cytochrome c-type biogenesis protein CcmF
VIATLMLTALLFLCAHRGRSPFQRLLQVRGWRGLNPLLQHPLMVIHPPMLYLGFVGTIRLPLPWGHWPAGSSIPTGSGVRRWTLVPWLLLAIGILLAASGYVELAGAAIGPGIRSRTHPSCPLDKHRLSHSVMIRKEGRTEVWNMTLVILTYLLAIFGTFLTRSGIAASVHAFASPHLAPIFCYIWLVHCSFSCFCETLAPTAQ